MRAFTHIAKALSDENRVRAVLMLDQGEMCLCQIIDVLNLAPSTVSRHMSILRDAGLVLRRKEGTWHYYRLPDHSAEKAVRDALKWTRACHCDDPAIRHDAQVAAKTIKTDKRDLCACYGT